MPRRLRDFSVMLVANGAEYKSHVRHSPAGQDEGTFTPPVQRTELKLLRQRLSVAVPSSGRLRDIRPPAGTASQDEPGVIGKEIGDGFFKGKVELLYVRSLGAIQSTPEDGLRISIHMNISAPDIAWLGQLPWELIRDGHHYLLRDPKYSLARCLDLPEPLPPASIKQPLKVLIVLATPVDLPPLDAESEYRELDKPFRESPSVTVELLDKPTPEGLGQRVREETFHVVHFIGHAGFDPGSGKGRLWFETADGERNPVEAEELADLLRGEATPQLLVLNACETAVFSWQDDHDPWSGLATALLREGFPAVVAMQFPITDKAAVAFSRGFYGLLAAGYPVDIAITGGRQAIFVGNHRSFEWATPVLYLHGMEGDLFKVETQEPKHQKVVIEVHGERRDIEVPYEDKLVDNLTDYLQIVPADLKSINAKAGKGRFTIELPSAAAKRLLEAARSSEMEFERRRAALAISYVEPFLSAWGSVAITLGLGILGNLLAARLQQDLLRNFLTLPRVVSLLALSMIFLYWRLFARIRRWLRVRQVIATLFASAVLVAGFAVPAALLPDEDCDQISRVELDLPMAHQSELNLYGDHVTDISAQDLQGIQRLSGRAVLSNPGPSCVCQWSGKTDQDERLTNLGSSADCSFTIDLPVQYSRIHLQLKVGERTDLFVIRVQ